MVLEEGLQPDYPPHVRLPHKIKFGLMAVLMWHTYFPTVEFNQRNAVFDSVNSSLIGSKTLVVLRTGTLSGAILDVFDPGGQSRLVAVLEHQKPDHHVTHFRIHEEFATYDREKTT